MIISGKITGVKPLSEQGYGPRGDIHYQDIQITDVSGQQHVGNIGSKSGYQIGVDIQVTMEQTQQGMKFKKYNPQYDNATAPQQGFNQQASQAPSQPLQGRDFNKENKGKCRFGFYQALLRAGMNPATLSADNATLRAIEKLVDLSMEGLPQMPPEPDNPFDSGNPDDIPF